MTTVFMVWFEMFNHYLQNIKYMRNHSIQIFRGQEPNDQIYIENMRKNSMNFPID
jgi:hypothetical protein